MRARCPLHPDAEHRPIVRGAPDAFWGCDGAFDYAACAECGTWVLDPRPAPTEIGPFYAHYYGDDEIAMTRWVYDKAGPDKGAGVDDMRAAQVVSRLKKLDALPDDSTKLLDVGCGLGGFARAMRVRTGAQVEGVDFDPKCRALCAELHGMEVKAGELAEQRYDAESFDVVSSWHCLEHTYDPAAELTEMARITKPGGWMVLEVPTPSPLAALFRGRWFFLQAPTHLYHLTRPAVSRLLEDAGWEPVRMERPWAATELAGSLLMALGHKGFAPRLLFKARGLADQLWRLLFFGLLPLDLLATGALALARRGGVLRVYARRRI